MWYRIRFSGDNMCLEGTIHIFNVKDTVYWHSVYIDLFDFKEHILINKDINKKGVGSWLNQ